MRFCFNATRFLLLVASCALIAQWLELRYLEEIGVSSGWAAETKQSDGFPAFYLPEGQPCGDTFPIYKDGTWHLFCLRMPGFGHFVTRDLVHWENRPFLPFGDCTGTVVEHQGKYYLFYTHHQQIWLTSLSWRPPILPTTSNSPASGTTWTALRRFLSMWITT